MISIYSAEHAAHDPPFEFLDGALVPVYESPARATIIHTAIERAALGAILAPRSFGAEHIRAVHSDDYLDYLEHIYQRWVAFGAAPASVMPGTLAVRWMNRRCDHPVEALLPRPVDDAHPAAADLFQDFIVAEGMAFPIGGNLPERTRQAFRLVVV